MIPCRHVRPSPQRLLLGVAAMAYAVGFLVATPAHAIHRQTEFLVNPSGFSKFVGGNSTHPAAAKGEPGFVAFESTSDLLGNGSVGKQIFFFDMHKPRSLAQITHHNGDSANPSLSKEGALVVFDSSADILQTGSSARQIFLWKHDASHEFVQLTYGNRDSIKPDISQDETTVIFESEADLAFTGNNTSQIFLYDLTPNPIYPHPALTQITQGPGTAHNALQDDLGQYIVFDSDEALDGPSNGSRQIFVYDRRFKLFHQLTHGTGDSIAPSMDLNAGVVVFQSAADLMNNGSVGQQIFMLERNTETDPLPWTTPGKLRQLTNSTVGENFHPSIERFDRFVSWLSTADLLGTGATGQQVFVFHTATALTFQITSKPGGFSDNNNTVGNFVLLDTDEDLMKNGATGRQVYTVDLWRKEPHPKPREFIGRRTLNMLQGGSSHVDVITRDGTIQAPMTGSLLINLEGRDFRGEAKIDFGKKNLTMNPIAVPGFGKLCLSLSAAGEGLYTSYGSDDPGDVSVIQDHDYKDGPQHDDPGCVKGCPDGLNARSCPGFLPGPHTGLCRGPAFPTAVGNPATSGAMELLLPLTLKVSTDPGVQKVDCTSDDDFPINLPVSLRLTTGSATGAILNADAVDGQILQVITGGVPFEPRHLESGNINGKLVGMVPLLDVPGVPTGVPGVTALRDMILSFHVEPFQVRPYVPACTGVACKILTVCTKDSECEDSDVCNGTETCVAGTCTPGTIPTCTAPGPCQFGVCDPTEGCLYYAIPNCCVADADCNDGNLCNGTELCNGGTCVSGPGAVACDDGLDCNGKETCDPGTGSCIPGVSVVPFSWEGVFCRLQEMSNYIAKFDPRDIGGPGRVKRMNDIIKYVTKHLSRRTFTGVQIPDCRGASGRLRSFVNLLDRGEKQGTISSQIAEPLADMTKNEILRVAHACVGAPQP